MLEPNITAEALAAGERLFSRPWHFVRGVPSLEFLPDADRPEIAFAGRSNVGKSSLLNALVRQRGLARTSNTPGRTQELNFFAAPGARLYLVDMPGYGFAKAPKDKVDAWTHLVKDYLRGRPTLKRVFLLIDARHGPKPPDGGIMAVLGEAAVSYQLVLTKADKITESARKAVLAATSEILAMHAAAFPEILATSAARDSGVDLLRAVIAGLVDSAIEG
jgi:GTP-binding protein